MRRRLLAAALLFALLPAGALWALSTWPSLLPGVPATTVWHEQPPAALAAWPPKPHPTACPDGNVECVDAVVRAMDARVRAQRAGCDRGTVFALVYLLTTRAYRTAAQAGAFTDPAAMNREDVIFAGYYFAAMDAAAAGRRRDVPAAWNVALRAARERDLTSTGLLLLGMNAHIQRDLPFAIYEAGNATAPAGHRDHLAVNAVLGRVMGPARAAVRAELDPQFGEDLAARAGIDPLGLVRRWRARAWRSARALATAGSPARRHAVAVSIEQHAARDAIAISLLTRRAPWASDHFRCPAS